MLNAIPAMTNPLGAHWGQPVDIRSAPMDDTHVILTPTQKRELCNYDASLPSGTYPGKCWLRTNGETTWLVWYGEVQGKDILIGRREVLEMDA